jgi:hypothetical protein
MLMKNEILIEQGYGAFNRHFVLVHVLPAIVPAGSGTRYQNECYAVYSRNSNGSRSGQQFKTFEEAENTFKRYTTPIVEISA